MSALRLSHRGGVERIALPARERAGRALTWCPCRRVIVPRDQLVPASPADRVPACAYLTPTLGSC